MFGVNFGSISGNAEFYSLATMFSFGVIAVLILIVNWRENYNALYLKLNKNAVKVRFKTASRQEITIVASAKDKVFKRKHDGKSLSFIVDATKIFYAKLTRKHIPTVQLTEDHNPTVYDLVKEHKTFTMAGKVPIIEYKLDDAVPIDPYSNQSIISSELLEGMLIGAEATADIDFFKKLFGYKNIWMLVVGIAIAAGAAAFFGFQILNQMNTNPYLLGDVPVCTMVEAAKTVVAK